MRYAVKLLVGLLLLVPCATSVPALLEVIAIGCRADTFWVCFLAGVACWFAIYLLLPKPMWVYVFGHEFTHALWSWLFGGRLKRMKVSSKGGHVVVTRSNFLVALAPYFFPLYSAVLVAAFALGNAIWDWRTAVPVFHLLLGASYAFHATLTNFVLQTQQSDLAEHGYLFSFAVIWLGNMFVLLLGLPLLTGSDVLLGFQLWWSETFHWINRAIALVN